MGYRLLPEGRLAVAPKSVARAKTRIRRSTRRKRGVSLAQMIEELNRFLIGWMNYFRHATHSSLFRELDGWIRRKLRCFRLKQRKRAKAVAEFLTDLGVPEWSAWVLALSGKGWWRKSQTRQACQAMSNAWFKHQGLVSLFARYAALKQ